MKTLGFLRYRGRPVLLGVTAIIALILTGAVWLRAGESGQFDRAAESSNTSVAAAGTKRLNTLFVGDDFTAGYGGVGRNAYPRIVCNNLLMNCNVDAWAGARLVGAASSDANLDERPDAAEDDAPLISRLTAAGNLYAADVVVIDAGRNDLDQPVAAYGAALADYVRRAADMWPAAKIVIVAPSFLTARPDKGYGLRVGEIARVARSVGGVVVDPIAERWYDDVNVSGLLQRDAVHPNQSGHQFIADKLVLSLLKLGIGPEENNR